MVSVPDQTLEGGSPVTPMVPACFPIPLITGRGTGTETCGIGSVFPHDDLWVSLDYYTNYTLIYYLLFKVWLMRCASCVIYIHWWGKGWPMEAFPFRALVVLYCMLPPFTKHEMSNVLDTVSTIAHLPRLFSPMDFSFWKTDWTTFHGPPLYRIHIIYSGSSARGFQA